MILDVNVVRLPHAVGLSLPRYASSGAAGADLCAAVGDDLILENGDRAAVPTGLVFEIPEGYEAQVRPRSGLAMKYGIALVNAPGTIDSDYRGEVKVILINLGRESVTIKRGERIAQLVLAPVQRAAFHEVVSVDSSDRGDGGFGSTGR